MRIAVVVTSFHDLRIERTLASLTRQTLQPASVTVTDGSTDEAIAARIADVAYRAGARVVHEAGSSVARARNLALDAAGPETDAFAFLDTDQVAPPGWLGALGAGLEAGALDWAGGPTRPHAALPVMVLKEERLYAAARGDATRLPMGNSLWRARVFDEVGRFDERLDGGGEDWDLALRAEAAGFRGGLVEAAWVAHDLTGTRSTRQMLRKQFRYDVGGAMAFIKNRRVVGRLGAHPPRLRFHWTDLVAPASKAAALPVAWWRLRRTPDKGGV